MKKTILFLAMGVIIFATSCKKDDDSSSDTTPTPTPTKNLVSKITSKDSSYTEVTYNSDNLVTKVRNYDKNSNTTDGMDLFYSNGKLSNINSLDSNLETESIFNYVYDGAECPKSLYYIVDGDDDGQINDTIMTLEYYANSTMLDSIYLSYGALLYNKMYFTWNGNNISKTEKYTYNSTNQSYELSKIYDFEYDTKNNFKHGIGIDYLIFDVDDVSSLCANNLTKSTLTINGTIDNDYSKDYFNEYDSDKIIKTTEVTLNNDTTDIETYTYK